MPEEFLTLSKSNIKWVVLLIWFICLFYNPLGLVAANYEVRGNVSLGTFTMSDLKNAQKEVDNAYEDRFGVNPRDFNKFPPYYRYQLQILRRKAPFENLGIVLGYVSTGSKSHYKDYSGELHAVYSVQGYSVGLIIDKAFDILNSYKNFNLSIQLSMQRSYLNISGGIEVIDQAENFVSKYHADNLLVEPGVMYHMQMWKLNLSGYLGVNITFPGVTVPYTKEDILKSLNIDDTSIQWSGIRLGIIVGLEL